jgi:hypothetical protein
MTSDSQPMTVFFPFAAETLGVVVRVNPRFMEKKICSGNDSATV